MFENSEYNDKLSDGHDNNISVFLAHPKRYRITEQQLEVILPMIKEYDVQLKSLAPFVKCEAIISFYDYVSYLSKRINYLKKTESIVTYKEISEDVFIVLKKLQFNRTEINICIDEGISTLEDLRERIIERDNITIRQLMFIKEPLVRLYASFLINIAFLNIRSVIISGDLVESTRNLDSMSNRTVVPVKFIPKLGLEIEALLEGGSVSYKQLSEEASVGNKFAVGSIRTSEILKRQSNKEKGLATDYKLVNECFESLISIGYDKSLYGNAISLLEMQVALDDDEIENYDTYIEEFDLLWNYIISLRHNILTEMKKGRFIIADFSFMDDYKYVIAKE